MEQSWGTADPLGEPLYFLRMSGTYYSSCEFSAPWGLELPPMPGTLMFHVVTSGACWLEAPGGDRCQLLPGDLALLPHGDGHRLVSGPGTRAVRLGDVPRQEISGRFELLRQGGGGAATRLVCGTARLDHPAARHLLALLPHAISVDAAATRRSDWIRRTLEVMADEAIALRPGGETVLTRLADVLVIEAIRAWLDRDPAAQRGWLGALRDRQVGRALTLIHREPARAWTLGTLAAEVAMSRSAFAARFSELVGVPPMQYLVHWRMHLAATWLREHDAGLGEVAGRVGYQSEAAFSRAFKRVTGTRPGAVRAATGPARRAPDPTGVDAAGSGNGPSHSP